MRTESALPGSTTANGFTPYDHSVQEHPRDVRQLGGVWNRHTGARSSEQLHMVMNFPKWQS